MWNAHAALASNGSSWSAQAPSEYTSNTPPPRGGDDSRPRGVAALGDLNHGLQLRVHRKDARDGGAGRESQPQCAR
eukprot:3850827-Lingulodinium_polyedra.AAC.1